MFLSFLLRFGLLFSYSQEAVSLKKGGVVKLPVTWEGRHRGGAKLAVVDPMRNDVWNSA